MSISTLALDDFLASYLKIEDFRDYGPNGLQIEGKKRLSRIAFSVSADLESIKKAIDWKADALIVHHGLFWNNSSAQTLVGPHYQRVSLLIKNNINLLAYHLPLDAHLIVGNAASLGKKLGLIKCKAFGEYKGNSLGISGSLKGKGLTSDELSKKIEEVCHHPVIVSSEKKQHKIKTLGIITGGANNYWNVALEAGLDAYLTGEISEYNWHDAKEAGICYFAAGHHATETHGPIALMEVIKKKFQKEKIQVSFFDCHNPA